MVAVVDRIGDKVYSGRGGDVVLVSFFWDGADRRVFVPVGAGLRSGDRFNVFLREWYDAENKTHRSVWRFVEVE